MSNLTDTAETRTLQWLLGQATTAPVLPLQVRLLTALGTDAAPGTEVTGGTYTPVTLTTTAVVNGAASNSDVLRWEGIPNPTTVVGVEIWDAAGVRWWYAALVASKTITDGVLEIPLGDLSLSMA